jgi:hypothetical protein
MSPKGRRGGRSTPSATLTPIIPALGAPAVDIRVLPEPKLEFGESRTAVDPRIGIGLYGPFDSTDTGRNTAIRLGIVGTGPCIELFQQWLEKCRGRVAPIRHILHRGTLKHVPMDPVAYPFFPGFQQSFDVDVVLDPSLIQALPAYTIAELQKIEFFEPRVTKLVEMVMDRLSVLDEKPSRPHVVIVALPTEIRSLVTRPTRQKRAPTIATPADAARAAIARDTATGQQSMFDVAATFGVTQEDLLRSASAEDEFGIFHHGLKAQAMDLALPTQLIWEGTLEGLNVQDDASRAWNFWTAVYYKAGNIPWRAVDIARGTCFVGVSFYVDKKESGYRSCIAQAFSDHGEGLVMRGDSFKWDRSGSPHFTSAPMAEGLMRLVLAEYEKHLRHRPSRVVVHKWSRYWNEEQEGFNKALAEWTLSTT